MKILFLAANPINKVTQLRIEEEYREISDEVDRSKYSDQLQITSAWAVRASDLQSLLLRHEPDIVHFSGHGSPTGEIILEDETGKSKVIDKEALCDLFRILKHNIRLVVLNVCYAKEQAQALTETVDFTIGMSEPIEDKAAKIFSPKFYQLLASGRSLAEAFVLALSQLRMEGISAAQMPELMKRDGADESEFRIVQVPRRFVGSEGKYRPAVFLSWLLAIIATSLITDVSRRFLGDNNWSEIVAVVLQAVFITLAAIAAILFLMSLMRPASPVIERAAWILRVSLKRPRLAVVLTGIAFVSALVLWIQLSDLAIYYNERGIGFQYREQPDLSSARESYQQAIRLNPDYAQAHYNLATVYEDLQPEKAIEEYLLAIRYDSYIYAAYNNLARLYLLRKVDGDYERALNILSQAVDLSPQDEKVQYSLNKNLGWANYALKRYWLADQYLRKAISLRSDAAAAHCLLAYVLKEQGKDGVADECFACVSLAPGEKDVEANWLSDAQEYFLEGVNK